MIKKIRISNLRNNELLQFLNDILIACTQCSTEPMKLTAVVATLLTDTTMFDKLFKLDPSSPITQELVDLDRQRDNCLRGMHMVLEGYSLHFEDATKSAAQTLLQCMDKYGKSLHKLNLPAETSTIKSLVTDWTTIPAMISAVTQVNFGKWITELSTRNTNFNEKYISRSNNKATAPHVKTYDARMKVTESYRKLVSMVESGATFVGDGSYDNLINLINELVAKYNIIAESHVEDKDEVKTNPN